VIDGQRVLIPAGLPPSSDIGAELLLALARRKIVIFAVQALAVYTQTTSGLLHKSDIKTAMAVSYVKRPVLGIRWRSFRSAP
jgi:hypothetical protein